MIYVLVYLLVGAAISVTGSTIKGQTNLSLKNITICSAVWLPVYASVLALLAFGAVQSVEFKNPFYK